MFDIRCYIVYYILYIIYYTIIHILLLYILLYILLYSPFPSLLFFQYSSSIFPSFNPFLSSSSPFSHSFKVYVSVFIVGYLYLLPPNHLLSLPDNLTPHVLSEWMVEVCRFEVCGVWDSGFELVYRYLRFGAFEG